MTLPNNNMLNVLFQIQQIPELLMEPKCVFVCFFGLVFACVSCQVYNQCDKVFFFFLHGKENMAVTFVSLIMSYLLSLLKALLRNRNRNLDGSKTAGTLLFFALKQMPVFWSSFHSRVKTQPVHIFLISLASDTSAKLCF